MASVWKRLQRVNKRAAKFQYTASYHRIDLETSTKWKPNKLSIVWTRRSRRVISEALDWEPSLKDPLKGSVIWPMPDNHTVAVTLFKDPRTNELEDKDWTFVLEDVSPRGKRRRLAACALNMRQHASVEATQRSLTLVLAPTTSKITSASLRLTISCVLLREGRATDEDMQSLASLLSVNNNCDIAQMEDLDEDDYSISDNSASIKQMLDLTHQMELMTNSLTGTELLAGTPISIQSLASDNSRTPTAPHTPCTPLQPTTEDADTPKGPKPQDDLNIRPPDDKYEPLKISNLLPSNNTVNKNNNTNMLTTGNPNIKNNLNFVSSNVNNKNNINFASGNTGSEAVKVTNNITLLKGVKFVPTHLSKHNLKPLELKMNFNENTDPNMNKEGSETPVGEEKTPVQERDNVRDKTPVQDLLEWCRDVTKDYPQCKVTNLTTSWRNGIAFCAVIHHFRPDLIELSALQPEQAEQNVRMALEASSKLGIPPILAPADICNKAIPDRLAVMTHLFQLRAHFTGSELQVEHLGSNPQESSYLVGRHDTDEELSPRLFSLEVARRRHVGNISTPAGNRTSVSSQESVESQKSQERAGSPMRGLLTRGLLSKVLSPAKEKQAATNAQNRWSGEYQSTGGTAVGTTGQQQKVVLMTRRQLTDPFGSDDEDDDAQLRVQIDASKGETEKKQPSIELVEPKQPVKASEMESCSPRETRSLSPSESLPKPTQQLLSRHDELKERARQLLEATKREAREKDSNKRQSSRCDENVVNENHVAETNGGSPQKTSEEARQAQLRERARRLIADARAGLVGSPTSPTSPSRYPRHGTVEIISRQSMLDEIAAAGGLEQLDNVLMRQESNHSSDSHNNFVNDSDAEHNGNHPDSTTPVRSSPLKSTTPSPSLERRSSPQQATGSPLHSFSDLIERLTPDREGGDEDDLKDGESGEVGSYIQSEMEALEREQTAIDKQAALLEKELRRVMESSNSTEEEDRLMSRWFTLVNKKNALLRRQMQLNILEQEDDLCKRCALLARELRCSLAVEEWRKSAGQRRRERLLLQELLAAVDQRDRLVHEMDTQERAIEDDDEIERNLTQVEIQRKNNCILQ